MDFSSAIFPLLNVKKALQGELKCILETWLVPKNECGPLVDVIKRWHVKIYKTVAFKFF